MPDEQARPNHKHRVLVRLVTAAVILALIGYVSNTVGLDACEENVLSWHLKKEAPGYGGRMIHVVEGSELAGVLDRLPDSQRPGYELVTIADLKSNPYPWCSMQRARGSMCPFLVKARLGYAVSGCGGAGGEVYVFNFFGACFVLGQDVGWMS